MQLDLNKTYELHRPKELSSPGGEEHVRATLTPEQFAEWLAARDRAGTGGPIAVGGRISRVDGAAAQRIADLGEEHGARPCRLDEETGQAFVGEFVLVPVD